MIQKVKFTIFIFSLLFMRTTSYIFEFTTTGSSYRVWFIQESEYPSEILYEDETAVNDEWGYIFIKVESNRCDIIYCVGKKVTPSFKAKLTGDVALAVTEANSTLPDEAELHITRKMFDSKIRNFRDLLTPAVTEKIPRLYEVIFDETIIQIPLKYNLMDDQNAYVLHDGRVLIVYYTNQTNPIKRQIVESLALSIAIDEGIENISNLYKEQPDTAKRTFIANLINAAKVHSEKTMDYRLTKDKKRHYFKNLRETLKEIFQCDDEELQRYDRALSSTTASTSAGSTSAGSTSAASASTAATSTVHVRKGHVKKFKNQKSELPPKVIKTNTIASTTYTPTASTKTISTPIDTTTNIKPLPLVMFLGPPECNSGQDLPLIDTLISNCAYVIKDLENNELFVCLGKNTSFRNTRRAFLLVEVDQETTSGKLSIYVEGNIMPSEFIIYIGTVVKKFSEYVSS